VSYIAKWLFLRRYPTWEADINDWDCECCTSIPGTSSPTCPGGEDCHFLNSASDAEEIYHEWKQEVLTEVAEKWFQEKFDMLDKLHAYFFWASWRLCNKHHTMSGRIENGYGSLARLLEWACRRCEKALRNKKRFDRRIAETKVRT